MSQHWSSSRKTSDTFSPAAKFALNQFARILIMLKSPKNSASIKLYIDYVSDLFKTTLIGFMAG